MLSACVLIIQHPFKPLRHCSGFLDVEKGTLKTERKLNGDETRSGKFCMMPNEEPDYGGFPICVTIPARTMIAEVEVYSIEKGMDEF